jgi:eukaryotic-like serine/threonine-protein kinase
VRVVPFDAGTLEVTGTEVPVLDNVFRGPGGGAGFFAVASRAGTLIYVQASFNRALALVDRNGREVLVPATPRGYRFPRVSPDGRYVAVTVDPRPSDLWVVDLVRGSAERQQTPLHDGWGVWSPDGKRLAFLSGGIWERAFPFADEPRSIAPNATAGYYPHEWPTNDRLLAETGDDLVAVSVSDGVIRPLVASAAREHGGTVSPDGRWIAFESDASGTNEIYVQPYPDGGRRQTVSVGGGVDAAWARDGTELCYRRSNTIFGVRLRTGERFEILGAPVALFTAPYDFTQTGNWTTIPGGRFLMIKSDPTTTTRFQVVFNWFEELRSPTK